MERSPQERVSPRETRYYLPLGLVSGAHSFTHMYAALMPLIYRFAMAEFGVGYTAIGLLTGASSMVGGLLQGPAGLLGRYMPRRLLIGLGNMGLALSMMLTAASQAFATFFAFSVLGRAVQSPQHPVGNSLVAEWFGRRLRGTAFAINYSAANLGSIFVPLIAVALFALVGWRWTLVLLALPGIIVGALVMGLIPEKGKREALSPTRPPPLGADLWRVFRDRNTLLVILGSISEAGERGLVVMTVYIPLYLSDTLKGGLGLDQRATGALFTLLLAGSVVGPLALGWLSDRFGRRSTIRVSLVLSSLSTLALIGAGANIFLVALAIVAIGFVNYPSSSLFQTLLADVSPPSVRDLAFSVYFPLVFGAGALWALALGYVVDTWGFKTLFYITAAAPLLALPWIFLIREPSQ